MFSKSMISLGNIPFKNIFTGPAPVVSVVRATGKGIYLSYNQRQEQEEVKIICIPTGGIFIYGKSCLLWNPPPPATNYLFSGWKKAEPLQILEFLTPKPGKCGLGGDV